MDGLSSTTDTFTNGLVCLCKSWPERGQHYARRYASLVNAEYAGTFFSRALAGSARVPGTGRVMIDVASYRRANPRRLMSGRMT